MSLATSIEYDENNYKHAPYPIEVYSETIGGRQ